MTDSDDLPSEGSSPAGARGPIRRNWRWIALLSVFVVPALLLGLWTAITMIYTYSSGERAGYIQKFSERGWICKTWEGELAMVNVPGAMQERFEFTVRSDSIAGEINRLQGKRVAIHYEQHKGVPISCIGETEYFVDGVRALDPVDVPGIPSAPATGAPAPATPAPGAPGRDTIDRPSGNP